MAEVNQEQHKTECLARWNALIEEARQKYRQLKAKQLRRSELEDWLRSQSDMDERALRKLINSWRV